MHRQLVEEGYQVGSTTVRAYLAEKRRQLQEVYVPLVWCPGEAAQVDFFEVTVEIAGQRQKAWLFVMRLMYSGRDFAWIYELYRSVGLPIGSGVESACKNVVAARMKQGGMMWTLERAKDMPSPASTSTTAGRPSRSRPRISRLRSAIRTRLRSSGGAVRSQITRGSVPNIMPPSSRHRTSFTAHSSNSLSRIDLLIVGE